MKINTISSMQEESFVYWEKQEKDIMTCGVHCLNTLLQGPYFTAVDLSNVALKLDREEKAIGIGIKYGVHIPLIIAFQQCLRIW